MATTYNAGIVTAYGAAVRGGYTGTYEEFCRQQAGYAQSAAAVEQAKEDVQELVDSIPADYTQLSEDVSLLKEDSDDLDERVTALEQGGSGSGLTEDIKAAMLQIAQKVAYIDAQGQTYYDAMYNALYPPADLVSISAVYTQSGTVYDTDTLDSLKEDLAVTAHYSDQTTETVTTYTLSGTLAEGTSIITVSYYGKTTTFNVTVTGTILYEVLNKAYNKTDPCDDTNIQLMATDTDFTILMDGIQENAIPTGNSVRIIFCADAGSNWKGIFLGASASASAYAMQWMSSDAGNFGFNRNVGGTSFKIAYRHTAGSGKVDAFIKINNGTVITKTITSPYASNSRTLTIGGAAIADTSSNWVGTMNLCRLHNVALTDDYINAFMTA